MSSPYEPSLPLEDTPRPAEANGVGIAGFVVSLVGAVLTCGLVCPLGLLLSLFGLLSPPRGFAIAGTIIGTLGTLWLAFWGFAMVAGIMGISEAASRLQEVAVTQTALARGCQSIEEYINEHGGPPEGIEGNKLVIEIKDGWDNELRYELESTNYQLRSAGPDGEFDTPDDVTIDDTGRFTPGETEFEVEEWD